MSITTLSLPAAGVFLLSLVVFVLRVINNRVKLNRRLKGILRAGEQYEFLLCDIRPTELYEKGHIPFAFSFPAGEVTYLPVEDLFLTIIIYGSTKKESQITADYLSENGYFNVISYGRLRHWRGPLEQGKGLHVSQFEKKGAQ